MDIKSSLDFVLQSKKTLGKSFYRRLLAAHPRFAHYFEHTDINRQAILLTMQLSVIEVFYRTRSPQSEKYLQVLGTRHREWGIPQEAYPDFCEVLADALRDFHGDQWTEDLARQWEEAIDISVQKMFDGYDKRS